ncbi:M1 family metallopeptidase [Mariniblastus fucicola]|uniref:Aminopeptidase N n=1 Tax=Mariniblastus fucicola TaxID=980251 RepID=A0A5B9P7U9_9BACT|nr:M1 family metallopeptidase [Mariniblastus fucicola]QEG21275.1 Aminopeptidase N [Mariniblastus fucicola]
MKFRALLAVLLPLSIALSFLSADSSAQSNRRDNGKFNQQDKFRQLEEILPTPGTFRTASGAPGHAYWQQKVDYEISISLNDNDQTLSGSEKISYTNNSPDKLKYLWLQLDGNIFRPDSAANRGRAATRFGRGTLSFDRIPMGTMQSLMAKEVFDGGFNITTCKDVQANKELKHTIVDTMMRVDLPAPLSNGETFEFQVDWNYELNNSKLIRGRAGCELFEEDGNYIYEVAQWFPRLCAYTDTTGWQHKQFLGSGEFTLELGDYVVRITSPADHIVASTGVLLNPDEVLTDEQRERLKEAESTEKPMFIVTPEEARANESSKSEETKTWIFKADQVRDFAWASSRKFIWDAMQHNLGDKPVMAMSYYPNEGEPLWSKYSTHSIIHTLNVYSRYTFDYPYPVAISVNGPVGGMEYPMICFNGPRPEKDGTYSARTKYGLISVIIHEVGHNYFPMIVNSDERQWTWMDEGLNTFLQYLAEQEWEENYPSRRGEPNDIVSYMRSNNQVPIMTNSESILQFGPNGYSKPATALNILRETILGRELFDFAFKEYAQRWKFKRPMPADFFRSMEDASGVDLDWFWRGWFYSTDHVDIAVTGVRQLNVSTGDPEIEKGLKREQRDNEPETLSKQRNKELTKRADEYPELNDFYNEFDPLDVTDADRESYERFIESLDDEQKKLLEDKRHFYLIDFANVGGLVMPIIFDAEFEDGSKQRFHVPAEIWTRDNEKVTRMVITEKPIAKVTLDPQLETADVDLSNNYFPPQIVKSRFELFKDSRSRSNEMQKANAANKKADEKSKEASEDEEEEEENESEDE